MSTTDNELAGWEQTLAATGFVPEIHHDTPIDPDYLVARLRDSLERAAQQADEQTGNWEHRAAVEAIRLRIELDRLIAELRPRGRAGIAMLERLYRICPTVVWRPTAHGFHGGTESHTLIDPTESAVAALDLITDDDGRTWAGSVDSWTITLTSPTAAGIARRRLMIGADTADYLIEAGADLQALSWSRNYDGFLHGQIHESTRPGVDDTALAEQWAAALGLTELVEQNWGTGEYRGDTPVGPVMIWWIRDRARWDANVAENEAERAERAERRAAAAVAG